MVHASDVERRASLVGVEDHSLVTHAQATAGKGWPENRGVAMSCLSEAHHSADDSLCHLLVELGEVVLRLFAPG